MYVLKFWRTILSISCLQISLVFSNDICKQEIQVSVQRHSTKDGKVSLKSSSGKKQKRKNEDHMKMVNIMKKKKKWRACQLRKRTPASMATILVDIINKNLVFFCCPWSFLQTLLVTTWCSSHSFFLSSFFKLTLQEVTHSLSSLFFTYQR